MGCCIDDDQFSILDDNRLLLAVLFFILHLSWTTIHKIWKLTLHQLPHPSSSLHSSIPFNDSWCCTALIMQGCVLCVTAVCCCYLLFMKLWIYGWNKCDCLPCAVPSSWVHSSILWALVYHWCLLLLLLLSSSHHMYYWCLLTPPASSFFFSPPLFSPPLFAKCDLPLNTSCHFLIIQLNLHVAPAPPTSCYYPCSLLPLVLLLTWLPTANKIILLWLWLWLWWFTRQC